jgi:hypothetical protein
LYSFDFFIVKHKSGGFVFANDDYGMDESFRKLITGCLFGQPAGESEFQPPDLPLLYSFDSGLPMIHELNEGPPKRYGLFLENKRLAVY